MTDFVQIKDDEVIATFGSDQDPENFPGVIEVEEDDIRLTAYWEKWEKYGVRRPYQ